ncbi:MAG: hypothetical protein NZ529_03685 [Cytophagaceae bacterium]|nr:hypothetical protein [Cytophagaceae bacterium]MDW8455872.1 hypothetical protein [Cytophagaceae bacterium]
MLRIQKILLGISLLVVFVCIHFWFVDCSTLYTSNSQKIQSVLIALGNWGVQMGLGLIFYRQNKTDFLLAISYAAFTGSLVLVPYCWLYVPQRINNTSYFIASIVLSTIVMVLSYFYWVRKSQIGLHWWAIWLLLLSVSVVAQIKVVFGIFIF